MPPSETEHPVVCVLFDAADKGLIESWIEEGRLPNLARIRAESSWTTIVGPFGMHAAGCWPTLLTGAGPSHHGHHAPRQIVPGTYRSERQLDADWKLPPFWKEWSAEGLRMTIIDVPYVNVDPGMNGTHVANWYTHSRAGQFETRPAGLRDTLLSRYGDDDIGLCDHIRFQGPKDYVRFRDQLVDRVRRKTDAAIAMIAEGGYDLFMLAYGDCHCVGHQCWHLHDPSHPGFDPSFRDAYGDPILDVYRATDEAVGRLRAAAPEGSTFVFVATHGMSPNFHGDHLAARVLERLGVGPRPLHRPLYWRAARAVYRRLPAAVRSRLASLQHATVDSAWPELDATARCFHVDNGELFSGIRVNLEGREPAGTVKREEFDAFCTRLAEEFLALENVATGRPAVRRVHRVDDVHPGPARDRLPDLMVEWDGEDRIDAVRSAGVGTVREPMPVDRTGHHGSAEGVLAICDAPDGAWAETGPIPTTRFVSILRGLLGRQASAASD